jgi:hypothetical protein
METEKAHIEEVKKEGKDTAELEANSLDERARRYFRSMVSNAAETSLLPLEMK